MEFRKKQAIYMQIADYICEHILAGRWQSGDKLKSIREMATNTEVNPNTITRTYTHLQKQGIIFNKRGIGYFISEDAMEKIRALKKKDFIQHHLPDVFRTMDLLGMDFEDLREIKKNINGKT